MRLRLVAAGSTDAMSLGNIGHTRMNYLNVAEMQLTVAISYIYYP